MSTQDVAGVRAVSQSPQTLPAPDLLGDYNISISVERANRPIEVFSTQSLRVERRLIPADAALDLTLGAMITDLDETYFVGSGHSLHDGEFARFGRTALSLMRYHAKGLADSELELLAKKVGEDYSIPAEHVRAWLTTDIRGWQEKHEVSWKSFWNDELMHKLPGNPDPNIRVQLALRLRTIFGFDAHMSEFNDHMRRCCEEMGASMPPGVNIDKDLLHAYRLCWEKHIPVVGCTASPEEILGHPLHHMKERFHEPAGSYFTACIYDARKKVDQCYTGEGINQAIDAAGVDKAIVMVGDSISDIIAPICSGRVDHIVIRLQETNSGPTIEDRVNGLDRSIREALESCFKAKEIKETEDRQVMITYIHRMGQIHGITRATDGQPASVVIVEGEPPKPPMDAMN